MPWRWHHFDHLTYRLTLLLKCIYFHLPADVPRLNAPELVTAHCSSHRRTHHSLPLSIPPLLFSTPPFLCSPLRLCLLCKREVYIHECAQTASSQENGKGIGSVGEQKYSGGSSPLKKSREKTQCEDTSVYVREVKRLHWQRQARVHLLRGDSNKLPNYSVDYAFAATIHGRQLVALR